MKSTVLLKIWRAVLIAVPLCSSTVAAASTLVFSAAPTLQEICQARVFEEPLVPLGSEPSPDENIALSVALHGYADRKGPDDFSHLETFLEKHPTSSWAAALWTGLGLEYYNTAHYSSALQAWEKAWALAKSATEPKGKAIGDRAAGELAYMYARLGRMTELEALLKSVEGRVFLGAATEKIAGAREGLWSMKNRPEISFRCGPLALHRIKLAVDPQHPATEIICGSASTQKGFSLPQIAELSGKVGLHYQMAFREKSGAFVVPAVVHWKAGHYAAMVRHEGESYLLQDPTFQNDVWATREALEAETSGYFLIPPGPLLPGWRGVGEAEGGKIWGKGQTTLNDPKPHAPCDPESGGSDPCDPPCPPVGGAGSGTGSGSGGPAPPVAGKGLAVSSVHVMLVNLSLRDQPVGYAPPIGPPVWFWVRYNHREAFQPGTFTYANFGSKWTCDWISYITDNPQSLSADVSYYVRGGGTRSFTGFDTNAQTFTYQQYDQTRLTRLGAASYEMLWPDGSKLLFSQSDGSVGTSRKIFLTQVVDAYDNAVTLSYDASLRLTTLTDAIGQVTTLSYSNALDPYKITRVTDPFGRYASFGYDALGRLTNITDVIGLASRFSYETNSDFINALITPYGTNTFIRGDSGNTRVLETVYADGSRDRVEYNQTVKIPDSDPQATVPNGVSTQNGFLSYRNTYYWSRNASALGYGDYTKARLYHWLHSTDLSTTSGILESTKEALEGRVWRDYAGQSSSLLVGPSNKPSHVGRVLDDGSTQLYTYAYDVFGHVTNMIDPAGRTFSYIYAANGIDLLEVRMTRAGKNELLSLRTYNTHHLPLTVVDGSGQTNTYAYNSRGQLLTKTNPKNEVTAYYYDTNGYVVMRDGPLPGTNDVVTLTYDAQGRVRTKTDESGYRVTFDHDDLDRLTRVTYPDSTYDQIVYARLDPVLLRDRAGRQTSMDYNNLRQLTRKTDPLGRVTLFQWCSCGDIRSLTDPLGRTTTWQKDVQNRLTVKSYGDGSQITYRYENSISRLREITDEKLQNTTYTYNRDNTLNSIAYANSAVFTHGVSFSYDPDYARPVSITDGTGTTLYVYVPITLPPVLGAGELASVDGPLPNDTITYSYDELGRRLATIVNGQASTVSYDEAGRVVHETNALGSFSNGYDGSSRRIVSETFPNGQITTRTYGDLLHDLALQRINHQAGATPISQFTYGRDISASRIITWSQQAGIQAPNIYAFGYDLANQLMSTVVTNASRLVNTFAYTYDLAGNRLSEQIGAAANTATYNSLNQISTSTTSAGSRTNEWDARNRLAAVNAGLQRTEFAYDRLGRLSTIAHLTNGLQNSFRRFVWSDNQIREERDAGGAVTKRYYAEGMEIESGPLAGKYYYTRDHLGSIREMTDAAGNVRARYAYDPFGRKTQLSGDLTADFGFAGMFFSPEAGLTLTRYRSYDPELGRWLSRDPLEHAEVEQGANLYIYAANDPANEVDPLGLCCEKEKKALEEAEELVNRLCKAFEFAESHAYDDETLANAAEACQETREKYFDSLASLAGNYFTCLFTRCSKPKCKHLRCTATQPAPAIEAYNAYVPPGSLLPVVVCFWE